MNDLELIAELRNSEGERSYIREAKIVLHKILMLAADRLEQLLREIHEKDKDIAYLKSVQSSKTTVECRDVAAELDRHIASYEMTGNVTAFVDSMKSMRNKLNK